VSKSRRVSVLTVGGAVLALALAPLPGPHATAARAASTGAPGKPVRGLDISAYQHAGVPVDWRLIARQGIRFAAIKLAEGTYYTNPYYSSDAKDAKAAGLAVLPYVFANPSRASPTATVNFAVSAIRAVGGERGHLPLVVDLENDPYNKSADCYGLGVPAMLAWIAGFTAQAEALNGKWPVIYTTEDWWRECTGSAGQFRHDPLWLAAFDGTRPTVPSPWRDWTFWQYSDDGAMPGLDQPDLDYYQPTGDLPALDALASPPKRKHHPRPPAHPKHKQKPKRKHEHKHKHKPKHKPKHKHKRPKRHPKP